MEEEFETIATAIENLCKDDLLVRLELRNLSNQLSMEIRAYFQGILIGSTHFDDNIIMEFPDDLLEYREAILEILNNSELANDPISFDIESPNRIIIYLLKDF